MDEFIKFASCLRSFGSLTISYFKKKDGIPLRVGQIFWLYHWWYNTLVIYSLCFECIKAANYSYSESALHNEIYVLVKVLRVLQGYVDNLMTSHLNPISFKYLENNFVYRYKTLAK